MKQISLHYHRAIALNNMGMSLLSKKAYALAMETFRGALNEMKMLVRPSQGSQPDTHFVAGTKFNKAYRALVNLGQGPQELRASHMVFDSNAGFHLPSVLNLVMDAGCFSATLCPIKIELADFECMDERDTDLDSAIMLYNLALVHRSVAAKERDWEKSVRIHKTALRLFRMSFALVSNTPLPDGLLFEEEQTAIRNRVHASAIFLYYQTRTLFDMGQHSQAEACLRHLSILGSELADMMDMGFTFDTSSPTAAAA